MALILLLVWMRAAFYDQEDNNEGDREQLEEEIETIKALYPEEVSVSAHNNTIECVVQMDKNHMLQANFTKAQQAIIISVSNYEKCMDRYSRKTLKEIEQKLNDICKEEHESMPIYHCVSYINDSLIYDMKPNTIRSKQKEEKTDDDQLIEYTKKNKIKETEKTQKQTNNNLPLITIYTWGNKRRKSAPIASQHNTNVCGVVGHKLRGLNLKQLDGKDEIIQKYVQNGKNYVMYGNRLKNKVMEEGLTTISINCQHGRHRSVAFAELFAQDLRNNYGYNVKVIHLEI
eukprot:152211_1